MQKTAAAMAHETIHSGHFMTSDPHTDSQEGDEEDGELEVDVVEDDEKPEENTSKDHGTDDKPVTFYKFGPKMTKTIAIDVSLNKLKKCIKVAYNKMTTPKWKDFKGIRLHWKQRIRLNNVIWRAYYIEFGKRNRKMKNLQLLQKKTPFCYFSVPDEDTTHTKIEGSVMEGMYWKRGMPAVCAQYKRWRNYSRYRKGHEKLHSTTNRRKRNLSGPSTLMLAPPEKIQRSMTPPNMSSNLFEYDDFENYFTDSLFDSLNQPYLFPDRDFFGNGSNADIMQPGLLPLQPSLEEIMASLEEDPPLESERCSPMLASQATEHIPGPSSIPTQAPPAVMAPPPMAPQPRLSTLTTARPAQDYAVASMLVDYSNQSLSAVNMPTRQPSSITSQMLMLSSQSIPPQYSTASYSGGSWKPPLFGSDSSSTSGMDTPYVPQYLQTQTGLGHSSHFSTSSITSMRSNWWMDSPLAVASPLSVGTTPLGGSTPLNPATPLGLGLGPTTPPNFRTELRSPIVRSTVDPNDMLSSIKVDPSLKSSLTHRLEQPSLLNTRVGQKPEIPEPWLRPTPSTTANLGFPSGPPRTSIPGRQMNGDSPWKISTLQPPIPVYPSFVNSTTSSMPSTPIDDSPQTSSRLQNLMDTSPTEIVKQEEGMMSAPPSVKQSKVGSRQVQADSTLHPEERKRILHLYAEQNRRSALKDGFEQLMDMIPDLYSGGIKPTNAVVLAKSAEHIRRLVTQKNQQNDTKQELQDKIARLNKKIATAQANLPSTSGMVSAQVEPKAALENFHDGYVKERSRRDFRFWVMSRLLQPLTVGQQHSFAAAMAGDASREELSAKCSEWMRMHWKGPELRPLASNMLVHLATNTEMLNDPGSLQDYVKDQLKNPSM